MRMTASGAESSKDSDARERFHDRVISLLLAAIWVLAALVVWKSDADIPASMLLIGTAFFIMLVPAMKELVRILDQRVRAQFGLDDSLDE